MNVEAKRQKEVKTLIKVAALLDQLEDLKMISSGVRIQYFIK